MHTSHVQHDGTSCCSCTPIDDLLDMPFRLSYIGGQYAPCCRKETTMWLHTLGLIVICAFSLLTAPLTAMAQPTKKVPTIGILLPGSPPTGPDWKQGLVFLQELRHLGWRENENL